MTPSERNSEYDYRVAERLGIMCENDNPTPEQWRLAREEALAAVKELKEQGE